MDKFSVSLTKENHELLKKVSSKRGVSMSNYVNSLIAQIGIADDQEKVILNIPKELTKKNKDLLQEWLQARVGTVINAFYPLKTFAKPASTNL